MPFIKPDAIKAQLYDLSVATIAVLLSALGSLEKVPFGRFYLCSFFII